MSGFAGTDTGLVLPAMDEASVLSQLKEYDSELCLVPQYSDSKKQHYYAVHHKRAGFLFAWMHPLSSALLEKVKLYDKNTRSIAPNADELEAKRKAAIQSKQESDIEDVRDDAKSLEGRIPHLAHGKFKGKR